MHPRRQGDLGEYSAIEWLGSHGHPVWFPVGHSPDCDLVTRGSMGGWSGVQVKTSTYLRNGRFAVTLCHAGRQPELERSVKRFSSERCDWLFVLVGDGRRWFIPADAVGGGERHPARRAEVRRLRGRARAPAERGDRRLIATLADRPAGFPSGQRGRDCKSRWLCLRRFESCPRHRPSLAGHRRTCPATTVIRAFHAGQATDSAGQKIAANSDGAALRRGNLGGRTPCRRGTVFVATTPGPDGSPKIMRDDNGKLVEDPRSAVFCPLKEGTTTLTMRVAGTAFSRAVTVREPLVSTEPTRPDSRTPELSGRCNAVAPQPPRRNRRHPSSSRRRHPHRPQRHSRRPSSPRSPPSRHLSSPTSRPSSKCARPSRRHPPASRRRRPRHPLGSTLSRRRRPRPRCRHPPRTCRCPRPRCRRPRPRCSSRSSRRCRRPKQRRRQEAFDSDEAAVAYRHPDALGGPRRRRAADGRGRRVDGRAHPPPDRHRTR